MPIAARVGQFRDELVIDALVDDAKVTEDRSAVELGDFRSDGEFVGERRAEMIAVDAGAVEVRVGIQRQPFLAHLLSAAEHYVGDAE